MFRHVPPRAPKTPRHPKTNPNPNPTPYTLTKQPYWTKNGVDDGFNDPAGRSFIRAWDQNSNNLMINGYNGVWTFDHDDCSQMVRDENNFMAWGGCKNFLGNHKACSSNVILYPGVGGRSAGDRRCQTDDNGARKRARRAAPRAHGGLRILLRNIFFTLYTPSTPPPTPIPFCRCFCFTVPPRQHLHLGRWPLLLLCGLQCNVQQF